MFCPDCGSKIDEDGTECRFCRKSAALKENHKTESGDFSLDDFNTTEPTFEPDYSEPVNEVSLMSNEQESFFMLYPIPLSVRQGRYSIVRQLGAGGMARVFLAKDALMNYPVVLKEMPPLFITREQEDYMKKRFRKEAQLLYRLRHKNLPRVTEYFIEGGSMFLVMDYIDGENLEKLRSKLPGKRISVEQCVKWMTEILHILTYLHNQEPPIIHRDVKPSNIMLTKEGEIFLVDFGTARASGSLTFTRVGTPGYASMEHFTGKFCPSSDLYSLGATFHSLLSGDEPGHREDFDFPPLSLYRDDIPNVLQQILEKMLQLKKEDRYQSAEEILNDLDNIDGKGEQRFQDILLPVYKSWTETTPKTAILPVQPSTVTILPTNTASWICLKTLEGHARAVTSVAFSPGLRYIATGSQDNTVKIWDAKNCAYIRTLRKHTDDVTCVLFSPNEKFIVSGSRDRTIRMHDAFRGTFFWTLTGHTDAISSIVYSDNGDYMISCSEDKTIRIWDTGYRVCTKILNQYDSCYNSVAISPDGDIIASGTDEGIIRLWDFETGKCISSTESGSASVLSVSFSPGGGYLVSGHPDGSLKIWDIKTGTITMELREHRNEVNSVAYSPCGRLIASGSQDRQARIWDASSGESLITLKGHEREILCVTFSPDGRMLASASADRTVKIWGSKMSGE